MFRTRARPKSQPSAQGAPRIAIVGCGAFTEVFYLPALAALPDVARNLILVDPNQERVAKLAERLHLRECRADHHDVLDRVDGAILAVPHWLHHPIALDFLSHGVHVLCEKPLAVTADQARAMIRQAEEAGVSLAVNHTQRLFRSNLKLRELLAAGALGPLRSIDYAWGSPFTWPTASGFYFDGTDSRRGGVLLDRGPHALDLICWWLGGKPALIRSENDSFGGIEAVAHLELAWRDCRINVRLSWLSTLANRYVIQGDGVTIENSFENWWELPLQHATGRTETLRFDCPERAYSDFARKLVANFVDVIAHRAPPLIPAQEVLPSIELIDACYAQATRFKLPWYDVQETI